MLMKKLLLVVPFAMFLMQVVAAQQAPLSVDRPAEPNMLFDDDGGKVQIVPADLAPAAPKTFHGGAVMSSVQQVSIFLGSGWGDAQVRGRQRGLSDMAGSGTADLSEVRSRKIKTMRAAPQVDDFSDLSKTLNDLDIQRRLDQMLKSNAIPVPNASTVFVVFLAPGTTLSLGGTKAGVDFAAYHNVVHLDAGEVRYVVVPFHADAQKHATAAARAFAEAALNPTGQGWF
jgi:hypothetical protein